MTKRKITEENTVEVNFEEDAEKVAALVEKNVDGHTDSLVGRHVESATIREVPSKRAASTSNPTETPELESEAEAFKALLAVAGYTVW